MVLYFESNATTPPSFLYMGKDKFENEDLIAYGLPEDIWFHADNISSAHVYVRLSVGKTMDDIDETLLRDCGQLVKANSIQGNKMSHVPIVYTPWSNLKKTGDMDIGQVGFHNPKLVRRFFVEKRENEIVNRLNKTKVEKYPDLREEQNLRQREIQNDINRANRKRNEEEKIAKRAAEERKLQKSYASLMENDSIKVSTDEMKKMSVHDYEDDFM
eukprot:Sdes_comp18510_c0_seq1m8552